MRSAKATAQDGESRRLEPEAELAVEGERRLVAELGVHDGTGDATPVQPMKGVGHEGATEALTLMPGVDRETLEVALAAGPTGDGIGEGNAAVRWCHSEPGRGHGPEGLAQTGAVQLPERREGSAVDGEDAAPVAPTGASRGASPPRWQFEQVVGQEMEALVGLEAGGQEGALLGGGERRRDNTVEALGRQTFDAPVQEVGRRGRPLGNRCEVGELRVSPPGGDPRPLGTPLDDGTITGPDHAQRG